ncbi:ribosomal protein bL36 [Kytococcus sedentarius]
MKVRASLRSLARQPGAQVVRRRRRIYVINRQNPRMKGRAG